MPPAPDAARAALIVVITAAAVSTPARLTAQPAQQFDAELGAAVLRRAGSPSRAAPTLGGVWAWNGTRTAVRADGAVATGSGDWAGQLAARAAYFARDAAAPLEFSAEARTARAAGTSGSTQLVAAIRHHLTGGGVFRPTRGVWVGGLGGTTFQGVGGATALVGAEAGAWCAVTAATRALVTATWTATRADSAAIAGADRTAELDPFSSSTSRVRTLDASAAIERVGPAIEITASAGIRHTAVDAGAVTVAGAHWGTLALGAVTWWIRSGVGAVVAAGTQPADPARGLPAVQHVALTLRLRPGVWMAAPSAVGSRPPSVRGAGPADSARDGDTRRRTAPPPAVVADVGGVLRVRAPGAARVQIRAAATAWRPVDLVHGADGEWTLALAWPSGAHRVAIRVDDGAWEPPANTPAVDDEFGGRVGLLVVP